MRQGYGTGVPEESIGDQMNKLSDDPGWKSLVELAEASPTHGVIESLVKYAEKNSGELLGHVHTSEEWYQIALGMKNDARAQAEMAERKIARVEAYRDTCTILRQEPSTAGLARALREDDAPVVRAHNHPPYEPTCKERVVAGITRGACLRDDGTDTL